MIIIILLLLILGTLSLKRCQHIYSFFFRKNLHIKLSELSEQYIHIFTSWRSSRSKRQALILVHQMERSKYHQDNFNNLLFQTESQPPNLHKDITIWKKEKRKHTPVVRGNKEHDVRITTFPTTSGCNHSANIPENCLTPFMPALKSI